MYGTITTTSKNTFKKYRVKHTDHSINNQIRWIVVTFWQILWTVKCGVYYCTVQLKKIYQPGMFLVASALYFDTCGMNMSKSSVCLAKHSHVWPYPSCRANKSSKAALCVLFRNGCQWQILVSCLHALNWTEVICLRKDWTWCVFAYWV